MQNILPAKTYNAAKALALSAGVALLGVVLVLLVGYVAASPTFGWTGQQSGPLNHLYFAHIQVYMLTAKEWLVLCFMQHKLLE